MRMIAGCRARGFFLLWGVSWVGGGFILWSKVALLRVWLVRFFSVFSLFWSCLLLVFDFLYFSLVFLSGWFFFLSGPVESGLFLFVCIVVLIPCVVWGMLVLVGLCRWG